MRSRPRPWNDEAVIACNFSFRCPKLWSRLEETGRPGIRACNVCDRLVHLVETEQDFEDHAKSGDCVAVGLAASDESTSFIVGGLSGPDYGQPRQ